MSTPKFQAKFCGILISLYQRERTEGLGDSADGLSASAILEILEYAAEPGNTLVEFSGEHYAELMLDIVVCWIGVNRNTSVQEVRFTLSEDSKIEAFLKDLESRRFEPWPPPIIYAAEKAQYLAKLKARGYLEA